MTFLLDTNTVAFLMRGDPAVRDHLTAHDRTDVFLCQPVVAGIEYGLARLSRSARRDRLRSRFALLRRELGRLPWTDDVSRAFAAIKADLERRHLRWDDLDVAVAAHAVAFDATLVTDDIDRIPRIRRLSLESWTG
jgi:tRNA(fMet)-specific endonuclease VapC